MTSLSRYRGSFNTVWRIFYESNNNYISVPNFEKLKNLLLFLKLKITLHFIYVKIMMSLTLILAAGRGWWIQHPPLVFGLSHKQHSISLKLFHF